MKRISRTIVCRSITALCLCIASISFASNIAFGQTDGQPALTTAEPETTEFDRALQAISGDELKRHIDFLASDTLQGREAGTQGNYAAGAYIVDQLRKSDIKAISDDGDYFQYFYPNFRNILAVIPGSDERLKNEFILVGGHYDHVGFGNRSNSRGPFGVVHNGADDNASGTAGILEIAESLASLQQKPKRSILIVFWDGEEKGLLGSRHYTDYPVIPLSQIRLHLNADMIGRLRPEGLEISGWRTATGSRNLLATRNRDEIKLRFMYSYKPESDHWPFFEHKVPSLMLHTGKHDDYHRPSDDTHLLNLDGIRQVSQFMLRCAMAAADSPTTPAFQEWSPESSAAFVEVFEKPTLGQPSRLGVTYNGKLAEDGVIQVTSVVSDSPANAAGLLVGDNVLALNDRTVKEAPDFRTLVMTAPAKTVFRIQRQGTELKIPVALRGDPMLFGFRWTMDDAEPGSVIVTQVAAASPADMAGLKPQHRIRAVSGRKISDRDSFRKLLATTQNPVVLDVEFDGRFASLSVERPIPFSNQLPPRDTESRVETAGAEIPSKK